VAAAVDFMREHVPVAVLAEYLLIHELACRPRRLAQQEHVEQKTTVELHPRG
jgi:hypothetical protein